MGNCFPLCRPNTKSGGETAVEGYHKVVNDILITFFGLMGGDAAASESASHHLPPTYELNTRKTYSVLLSPTTTEIAQSSSAVETEEFGGGGGGSVKRVKVVMTKKQLQELLSKQMSDEDPRSAGECRTCSSHDSPLTCWRPRLESIPEGWE